VTTRAVRNHSLSQIFEPRNRGILLDIIVLIFNLLLMWLVTRLSLNFVRQAEEDWFAKLALGFFFGGLLLLQPLGPTLKRWSFHQRFKSFASSKSDNAGCLIPWYMFFYIIIMLIISLMASLYFLEAFRDTNWEGLSSAILLGGIVFSFVNAVIIYRYFLTPKKEPRWKFLTTPQSEWLGDLCMFLNVICFQILWSTYTASTMFWESLHVTSHGQSPGLVAGTLFRFFVVAVVALLVYFPPRIFYLVIDRHRKITWLTMFLANLPLIFGVVLFSLRAPGTNSANATAPTSSATILNRPSFVLSAENFYREYELDSQAGAKKYSGQYVEVTGRVHSVVLRQDKSPSSVVRLDGGGFLRWVNCRFDEDQSESMKTLKEKQKVTLQGVGDRFWIGGPSLTHCVLVKAE
jgi:MFS family permease